QWASAAGQGRSFIFTVQPGLRMRLHTDSELCRLIYCRYFEAIERAFLNDFLRPGDVFVDVGANIGLFTLIAAICVGPKGKVFAFEPTTATFERLVDNVRLNDFQNVTSIKLALSDVNGQMDLVRSIDGFDAWNSFARPTMGKVFSKECVDAAPWDQYARQHDLTGVVTMMKIDVEGWESRVLAGGKRVFSRMDAPVLQVEFTDEAAMAAGSSCKDLYKTLEHLGYRMFVYDPEMRALVPESMRDEYVYVNLIAVKNPDVVSARVRAATP
ncbi:MAG TPA: FkbM family methyltransferase, partial [Blastocatellia bacterium]|nr:FkbM family methyltransferase [Blastocatellia bacterium]